MSDIDYTDPYRAIEVGSAPGPKFALKNALLQNPYRLLGDEVPFHGIVQKGRNQFSIKGMTFTVDPKRGTSNGWEWTVQRIKEA